MLMKQKDQFLKRALLSLFAVMTMMAGASAQDMPSTPLTLEAITEGDITFSITYSYSHPVVLQPVEYKINDGSWTTYASWPANAASITSGTGNWPVTFGDAIHVTAGDKVSFRGDNASYYGNGSGYECHITSTADVYVYGNMMSLVNSTDFASLTTLTGEWNFAKLFRIEGASPWSAPVTNTTIKSHPTNDIVLPATTLTNYCYYGLFAGCSEITRAPALPATTMKNGCYAEMFRATSIVGAPALPTTVFQPYSSDAEGEHGSIDCYMQMFLDCTSLTVAPALPATTLAHGVYQNMFKGCTSLVNAPTLPATDLTGGDQCYTAMFKGCTSLAIAPALPATTLDSYCYMEMFSGCTSLVNAPELPATTLAEDCYHRMFEGCTSLKKAPVLPAATIISQTYGGMFDGCTSLNYVKCLATNITDTSHGEDATTDCWLYNVAPTGVFVKADEADWSVKTKTGEAINGIPAGWTVKTVSDETAEMTAVPLTLEAIEEGTTISIANPLGLTIEYSTNGGTTWTSASAAPITISGIAAGTLVQLRGNNAAYATSTGNSNSTIISSDKAVYVYGNVMSLINSTSFASLKELTADYAFANLFYYSTQNSTITSHPYKALVLPATKLTRYCYANMFRMCRKVSIAPLLPATTLTEGCYNLMFWGCNTMLSAPELPATSLADYCYTGMFGYCTKLVNAPALPATAVGVKSYQTMFRNCTSLVNAPALPATTLATYCYDNMFLSCTKLVNAPALPATTLANYCYNDMFSGCTALTTAPDLPATTLVEGCYACMFVSCSSLNYVRCLATDLGTGGNTNDWMRGVAATGTFVKAVNADWSGRNTDIDIAGIPDGWTVKSVVALADGADNSTALTTYQGAVNDVTLSGRTLYRNGEWNTLCLPFSLASLTGTPLEGATIRPLTNASLTSTTLTLTFGAAVSAITAGTPYIVKWETTADNLTNPTFEGVTISSTAPPTVSFGTGDSQVQFIGTYAPASLTKDDQTNRYLGSGNKLYYPTTDGFNVNSFRAYFKLGSVAASAPMIEISFDETTGVRFHLSNGANGTYYTLDGRQLNSKPATKGIYIHNGKKVIIK